MGGFGKIFIAYGSWDWAFLDAEDIWTAGVVDDCCIHRSWGFLRQAYKSSGT